MIFKVNLYDTVHLNIDTQRHRDPLFIDLITYTYITLFYITKYIEIHFTFFFYRKA